MSRYIDADALINDVLSEWGTDPKYCESNDIDGIKAYTDALILERLNKQPTVDAVPVVRCGECKHHTAYRCKNDMALWKHMCRLGHGTIGDEWFCADGERKEQTDATN